MILKSAASTRLYDDTKRFYISLFKMCAYVPDLFVANLPFEFGEEDVRQMFSRCGTLTRINILYDSNTGLSKGIAFLRYSTEEEMQNALNEFSDFSFQGRKIKISLAKNKQEKSESNNNHRFHSKTNYDFKKINNMPFNDLEIDIDDHKMAILNLLGELCNSWNDEIKLYNEIQSRMSQQEFNEILPLLQLLLNQALQEKSKKSISFYQNSFRPFN